jgi:hypothetical protein
VVELRRERITPWCTNLVINVDVHLSGWGMIWRFWPVRPMSLPPESCFFSTISSSFLKSPDVMLIWFGWENDPTCNPKFV